MRRAYWIVLLLGGCTEPSSPAPGPREPPAGTSSASEVLAVVADRALTRSEVEAPVAMELYRKRVDAYSLVKRELDRRIERVLLELEAEARGTEVDALLEAELEAVAPVTDAEVRRYLEERGLDESRADRVRLYLEGRAREAKRLELLSALREKWGPEVHLEPPPRPRLTVEVGDAPVRGRDDAAVTLIHFGAYRDRRSNQAVSWVRDIQAAHPEEVRWVHIHAMSRRDEAELAAVALAREAHRSGRFWRAHDALFDLQASFTEGEVFALAKTLSLDPERVRQALEDGRHLDSIRDEIEVARRAGVRTPGVVLVNGLWFDATFGREKLRSLVQDELRRVGAGVRQATSP